MAGAGVLFSAGQQVGDAQLAQILGPLADAARVEHHPFLTAASAQRGLVQALDAGTPDQVAGSIAFVAAAAQLVGADLVQVADQVRAGGLHRVYALRRPFQTDAGKLDPGRLDAGELVAVDVTQQAQRPIAREALG